MRKLFVNFCMIFFVVFCMSWFLWLFFFSAFFVVISFSISSHSDAFLRRWWGESLPRLISVHSWHILFLHLLSHTSCCVSSQHNMTQSFLVLYKQMFSFAHSLNTLGFPQYYYSHPKQRYPIRVLSMGVRQGHDATKKLTL